MNTLDRLATLAAIRNEIFVPEFARNINTVQDAAARLRELLDEEERLTLRHIARGNERPVGVPGHILMARGNFLAWIEHAERVRRAARVTHPHNLPEWQDRAAVAHERSCGA